ncbi:MAG: phosphopentomutase, partial [Firmicutes bacterium]|nr:phosphopentomutase [Bacillota bacterium]
MSENRKVVLIITDSLGIGALPDAEKYGDQNADTFGHIVRECGSLNMPNLLSLGWGNIDGVCEGKLAVEAPIGCFGKMAEVSAGKDTTTGHWEIAGLKTDVPFKTYPDGFPKEFMDAFAAEIGTECIGNYPASGTAIIEELGPEHEATGKPIVYTSADSVLQIAANIDVIPLERLYEICKIARRLLVGEWACGRVIARPYKLMEDGTRKRTQDRHDYSVTPPEDTLLDMISGAGLEMYSVGKISDIFNGKGVTTSAP